ncbi:hypothetical protein F4802DRAFT_256675 [Xylaria palmicola]|nr:hypothetical protein F4802DRAFT_256675 [Xylaria palmicola]
MSVVSASWAMLWVATLRTGASSLSLSLSCQLQLASQRQAPRSAAHGRPTHSAWPSISAAYLRSSWAIGCCRDTHGQGRAGVSTQPKKSNIQDKRDSPKRLGPCEASESGARGRADRTIGDRAPQTDTPHGLGCWARAREGKHLEFSKEACALGLWSPTCLLVSQPRAKLYTYT